MGQFTWEEVAAALDEQIGGELPAERRAEVLEEAAKDVIVHYHPEVASRRIDPFLFSRDRAYAVPDDKLELVPSLIRGALGFFTSGPIGALVESVSLLLRYEELKVEIDADELSVLREMKRAKALKQGGLSAPEIANRLSTSRPLTAARTLEVLEGLLVKGQAAGDKVVLVTRDTNARWSIGNV